MTKDRLQKDEMLAWSFMNNVEAYLYEEDNSIVDQLLPLSIVCVHEKSPPACTGAYGID